MKSKAMLTRFALLLACFLATACGGGGKTLEWRQEVQLHDGRVIVVDRISKQTGKIFPENIVMESEQSLSFTHPDTQERIRWTLPQGLLPATLEFDKKTPYLILKAYTVSDYNKWDCPNPPWLIYRHEAGEWKRVRIEELPTSFTQKNLLPMFKGGPLKEGGGLVTLRHLEDYWRDYPNPKEARTISREKVNPIGEGCHESALIRLGRRSEIDTRR